MSEAQTTVDDVVLMALDDLFPGHKKPDTENYLPNGQQYKAPDHAILDGMLLIERKSRNAVDQSQFYEKLRTIASEQNSPFIGLGNINLAHVFQKLPDPELAKRKFTDYMMNQTLKRMKEARKKFESYVEAVNKSDQIKVLIISDNTEIRSATTSDEYYIGRKMGAINQSHDQIGIIDCVILIKDPRYAMDIERSYWFKFLCRNRLSKEDRKLVERFGLALHHRVGHYADFYAAASQFRNDAFRMTIV